MAPVRAQAVQGGNLQAMIAQVAARYGALTHQTVNRTGNCRCSGGNGNCVGCETEPIIQDFHRVKADDGRDGRPGAVISNRLVEGSPGKNGSFTIIVRSCDGEEQEYPSPYNLELVDFDIEDENGDGIFEPGEHIMVKRIRIRNTGEHHHICYVSYQLFFNLNTHLIRWHAISHMSHTPFCSGHGLAGSSP